MTSLSRLFTASIVAACALAPVVAEAGTFSSIAGSWTGNGKVHLPGGKSEAIKCNAYYIAKAGGAGLSMAIRCASAANKIDMRANLQAAGNGLSGSWEERQFNASGTVSGKATDTEITLNITGGGFQGDMKVKLNGTKQDVSITTSGAGFSGVEIQMNKNG